MAVIASSPSPTRCSLLTSIPAIRRRNIGQPTDISAGRWREDGGVLITIWTEGSPTLRGRVRVEKGRPVVFEGWLELLSALESALSADAPADGLSRQLDPGGQAQLPEDVRDVGRDRSPR